MTDVRDTPETPTPDDAAVARDLRMAAFRLTRRLRTERALDTISDGQFAVLVTLKAHGPHTLGDLASRERVTAPSMNRTVNCLEESGWITRTPDASDRRKVTIEIAEKGRILVEDSVRRHDAWLAQAMSRLSDADRVLLADAAALMREMAAA